MSSAVSGTDLRYPIGRYKSPENISSAQRTDWIDQIARLPDQLRKAVDGFSDGQLDTPYRPGGWTVRQVIHHLSDSHINSYTRFRLALTEDTPSIKSYEEAAWAELPDARQSRIEPSLMILDGLHERWSMLLRGLSEAQFARTFRHSELGAIRLDWTAGLYAWHSRHHLAHVTNLSQRMGW